MIKVLYNLIINRKEVNNMKKTLGQKINELRKQKGMTQDELAEKMGVSAQAVSKWEKDLSIPDMMVLIDLSEFFHVSLDELLKEKEETVQYVPKEDRKDIKDMFLKIRVCSSEGDKVNINLPLAILKMAVDMDMEIPQINTAKAMQNVDLKQIIMLVEQGAVGKLVDIESGEGDIVEVIVE